MPIAAKLCRDVFQTGVGENVLGGKKRAKKSAWRPLHAIVSRSLDEKPRFTGSIIVAPWQTHYRRNGEGKRRSHNAQRLSDAQVPQAGLRMTIEHVPQITGGKGHD
jgi:hypothetical protein